ncbi:MAG: ATP-binding protein [Oscillospiraceae bacterium]|nr:ATP-binding protein [Oscillospiraceae bacterium]
MKTFDDAKKELIFKKNKIGTWELIIETGKDPKLLCDETMDELLGVETDISAERKYIFHRSHIDQSDVQIFEAYAADLMERPSEVVYRYLHPTNGLMYVRCCGVKDFEKSTRTRICGTHQDITSVMSPKLRNYNFSDISRINNYIEERRKYSNTLYKNLLAAQPNGFLSYTLPGRRILMMNDNAKKMYDIMPDEILDLDRLAEKSTRIKYPEKDTIAKLRNIKNPGDKHRYTAVFPRRDGSEVQVFVNTELVDLGNNNKVVISTMQDITEIDELQKKNRRLREQFDIIKSLAQVYDLLYYISLKEERFVEMGRKNVPIFSDLLERGDFLPGFEKFYEISEEVKKEEVAKFFDLNTIKERLKDKNQISMQMKLKEIGWVEVFFIRVGQTDEELENLIFACRNIDDARNKELAYKNALIAAAEKSEAANKAKTTFLLNMSHDIRTPMNAIIGYTDLIKRDYDDKEKTKRYVSNIRISGQIMLSIINNVLEMAKIENNKDFVDESQFDIVELIDDIAATIQEQISSKGIIFVKTVEIIHKSVIGDRLKLTQILLNVLTNAMKYTNCGGRIEISVKENVACNDGKSEFEIKVEDTGIGMSEDYLPHIFEMFSRERNQTESKIDGTGLGLSIVKKLSDMLGGKIFVKSKEGVGTAITLSVPLKTVELTADKTDNEKSLDGVSFDGKRALLVEDNDLNAEIGMEFLEEFGLTVDRAVNGKDCVEIIRDSDSDCYDIIFMDIQMPKMNGYEATLEIRKMADPLKSNIPIVAMTANGFREDEIKSLNAGMNAHITKPINRNKLKRIVEKIFVKGAENAFRRNTQY